MDLFGLNISTIASDSNRLTQKRNVDRSLLQRGTTKHLQTHKHNNPRQAARAFFVPIGVFAIKIGRFRCKPIAQMPSDMSTVLRGQIYKITNNSPFSKYISQKNNKTPTSQ